MTKQGALIIIEGADGVGTTTQTRLTAQYLADVYPSACPVSTANPSSGSVGKLLREIIECKVPMVYNSRAMAALFFADRAEHLHTVVLPAINQGHWVVCDRNYQSTLVYQALAAYDPPARTLEAYWIHMLHTGLPFPPHIYSFILDVPLETTKQRRQQRGTPAEAFDDDRLQERILAAYREVPCWDWISRVIDCGDDSPEKVNKKIRSLIDEIIQKNSQDITH